MSLWNLWFRAVVTILAAIALVAEASFGLPGPLKIVGAGLVVLAGTLAVQDLIVLYLRHRARQKAERLAVEKYLLELEVTDGRGDR